MPRIFEDDQDLETLILCPKNLKKMWEDYRDQYRLRAKVLSITQVIKDLPELRRYRLIILDESQNLRNREGKRYRAIQEYIQKNESKCILLSATPYNKTGSSPNRVGGFKDLDSWQHAHQDFQTKIFLILQPISLTLDGPSLGIPKDP